MSDEMRTCGNCKYAYWNDHYSHYCCWARGVGIFFIDKSAPACNDWQDKMGEICGNCKYGRFRDKHNGECEARGRIHIGRRDPACGSWEAKVPTRDTTGRTMTAWLCKLMNILDFRYWFCECGYISPYGLVISADCKKHD